MFVCKSNSQHGNWQAIFYHVAIYKLKNEWEINMQQKILLDKELICDLMNNSSQITTEEIT